MGMVPPVNGYGSSCIPLILRDFSPPKTSKLLKLLKRRQNTVLVCPCRRFFQVKQQRRTSGMQSLDYKNPVESMCYRSARKTSEDLHGKPCSYRVRGLLRRVWLSQIRDIFTESRDPSRLEYLLIPPRP